MKSNEIVKERVPATKKQLIREIQNIGVVRGDLLHIKASQRSIGPVERGAEGVLDALIEVLGPEGTLVLDSFVQYFPLPLNEENSTFISTKQSPSYAGAMANAILKYPGCQRSGHPIQRYAAVGARAKDLTSRHTKDSGPYELLHWLSDMGGKNLKIGTDEKVIGVGTTHVAICLLELKDSIKRYGVNYLDTDGEVRLFERKWCGGGCGRGFSNFIPLYRERGAILGEGLIGLAPSKLTNMRMTLDIELEVLKNKPSFFLCSDPWCELCRLGFSFSSGPKLLAKANRVTKATLRPIKKILKQFQQSI